MSENPRMEESHRPLQIWQQNVNKSLLSQLDLLISLKCNKYNLCIIQEPYIDFNGRSRANRQWTMIYPHHSWNPPTQYEVCHPRQY
ncbi:hypothetical protein L208DRAFT_1538238 [Tricholoma matsutake]|nr:hypothetical protein L208DRAFT_1538238 [Tricholoma matsutake 945]